MGFILLAISTGSNLGIDMSVIYLLLYLISSIGIFAILISLTSRIGLKNTLLVEFSGLAFIHPILAYALTLNLFSLAGIPPLSGFISKYLILYVITSCDM
eukprot:Colp12_sorted_trinity150504_noHs@14546